METKGSPNLPTNLSSVPLSEEDAVVYIAIKGSLHANDCSVFGLGPEEIKALTKKYPGSGVVVNGVAIKTNVLDALNSLGIMDRSHECEHAHCTTASANASVCQTISEMDWERGIWNAAFNGEKERVQSLIDKAKNNKELVNAPDNAGYTALHYAARNGHVDVCKILLHNGANINAETKSGKVTPLLKAAAAGKAATVKLLIQYGAKVDAQDVDGKTALHKAIENKHVNLPTILLEACPALRNIEDFKGSCPNNTISENI